MSIKNALGGFLLAVGITIAVAPTAFAAGDLQVKQEGDTMYVTTTQTTTNLTNELNSPSTRTSSVNFDSSHVSDINPPAAFARDIGELINRVLTFIFIIAALLVFVQLVWGSLDWITSGGDKGKTEKARNKMVAAIVGLVIILASYAAINLIIQYFTSSSLNEILQKVSTNQSLSAPISPSPTATPSASPSL